MKGNSDLANQVLGAAIEVHKALGPGLLESTCQQCLQQELKLRSVAFEAEYPLPVEYKGVQLDCGYRLDFMVEDKIILELKSVETVQGIHQAQLLSYMRLSDKRQGFLINFNVQLLKQGIKSFVL